MRSGTIEAAAKLVVAWALLAGLTLLAAPAWGTVSTPFYVGVIGATDTGNTCTNPSVPCATLSHALVEQGLLNPAALGNVIEVARGTYADVAIVPTAANDDVTISGVSAHKTVINVTGDPTTLVDLSDTTGVTITKLQVDGTATAESVLGTTVPGATNTLSGVDVRGGAPIGVDATSSAPGSATVLNDVGLTPKDCEAKVKTAVLFGWSAPQNLRLNRLPSCARGYTMVYIDGTGYAAATSASPKTIVLTSGGGSAIAAGATVIFNTSLPAFTAQGIVCSGTENCDVSGSTVVDDAATAGTEGIVVTAGAAATLNADTVEGNSDSSVGIDLAPTFVGSDSTLAGSVSAGSSSCSAPPNIVSGYAVGILAEGDTNAGDTAVGDPTIAVTDNVVSARMAGIEAEDTVAGVAAGDVNLTVACNTVSALTPGQATGVELNGSQGERYGGTVALFGNTVRSSAVGMAVSSCSACSPVVNSTANMVAHNVIGSSATSANAEVGVLIGGLSTPPEFGGPSADQTGNTFLSNRWVDNGMTPGIFGANVLDGSGDAANLALPCTCVLGAPGLPAGVVPLVIPITNRGSSTVLAQGTIITVGGADYGSDVPPRVGTVAQFYVQRNQPLPSGTTTSINVSELETAKGAADTPIMPVETGSVVSVFRLATAPSGNTYSGNSCAPDIGGSAVLDAGSSTPAPGYDAC